MAFERLSREVFIGVLALVFAASSMLTVLTCTSMPAMGGMPMPGGWMMSMAWMRMPGQTWPGAAASFLGMWVVMMVAMMLPSIGPMLWRFRQAAGGTGASHPRALTAIVGVGYFFVWTAFGTAAFPLGVVLAAFEMQQPVLARAVPMAVGLVVVVAGALQLSAWKARCLACCRDVSASARAGVAATCAEVSLKPSPANERGVRRGRMLSADARTAWQHGVRLGLDCCRCCAGLMAILLAAGIMDLRAMVLVAAAITAERLAPAGERVARAVGVVCIGAGVLLVARAAGLV